MPGIASKFSFNSKINTKTCLERISETYKIPGLSYKEKSISDNSSFFYSLFPSFIKAERLSKIFNDRFVVAIDGDYYNHDEINKLASAKNSSKLESILNLYLKKGDSFAKYINGEFVIIIYDTLKGKVLVTNDRFARRSFYWYKNDNHLVLASEKKGIVSLLEENAILDEQGLLEVFVLRHNINGKTFIKGVNILNPSTVMIVEDGKIKIEEYFEWKFATKSIFSEEYIIEQIYEKLKRALRLRIYDKQNILLWLSGGYDSRAIAGSISNDLKDKFIVRTFAEDRSEELEIAKKVSKKLNLRWNQEKVKSGYVETAQFGAWRTEFSFSAMGHPFIGNHKEIKHDADYIISGLPGLDVLNGSFVNIGKIVQSFGKNHYKKWYEGYTNIYPELYHAFNEDFIKSYLEKVENSFFDALDNIKTKNKLDKWDIFIITQRQPNFSNVSDLCENDLFETLHPFCDIDLLEIFLTVPVHKRMFMQLSKKYLYEYFPELREISYDNRGKISSRNILLRTVLSQIKDKLFPKPNKSIIWNKHDAMLNEMSAIRHIIESFANENYELRRIFNFEYIIKILDDRERTITVSNLIDTILTFIFAYRFFISSPRIRPTDNFIELYN